MKSDPGQGIKCVTLAPLIIGILVCSIFTWLILYFSYISWIYQVRDDMYATEEILVSLVVSARSARVSTYFTNIALDLALLEDISNDENIRLSTSYVPGTSVNAYDSFGQSTLDSAVWASTSNAYVTSEASEKLDLFLRMIYESTINGERSGFYHQIGYVSEGVSNVDYRYPLEDMSYIKSAGEYDPVLTATYKLLHNDRKFVINYEHDLVHVFLNGTASRTYCAYTQGGELLRLMTEHSGYSFFIVDSTGTTTLAKDQADLEGLYNNLGKNLFPAQKEYEDLVNLELVPLLAQGTSAFNSSLRGKNEFYIAGIAKSATPLDTAKEYSIGTLVSKGFVSSKYSELTDEILNLMIFQVFFFLILMALALVCANILSKSITQEIVFPLKQLCSYLRGTIPFHAIQQDYNKEINQLIKSLSLLNELESFINPNYLLNPVPETQLHNLTRAKEFFAETSNSRGQSIALNLLGNINYQRGNFESATADYAAALMHLEGLLKSVEEQEQEESRLSAKEQRRLKSFTGRSPTSWDSEKTALQTSHCERTLQLCMARTSFIKQNEAATSEVREYWKQTLSLQVQVLQFYISSKIELLSTLKLMIDMSLTYENIQFYNSAKEILELVADELWKLENSSQGDIDISRLKRIGINVQMTESTYPPQNITFEKGILRQLMLYRRGLLLKKNDRYQEAGLAFTLALEQGGYYDPALSSHCIIELDRLLSTFHNLSEEELIPIKALTEQSMATPSTLMFVLAYDFIEFDRFSIELCRFLEQGVAAQWTNIGANSSYCGSALDMRPVPRDCVRTDFETLLKQSKFGVRREHVYDTVARGLKSIAELAGPKALIVFVDEISRFSGSTTLSNLRTLFPHSLPVFAAELKPIIPHEFREFVGCEQGGVLLECHEGSLDCDFTLSALRQHLFSLKTIENRYYGGK